MSLTADEVQRRLRLVDAAGWDSQPGEELLHLVRSRIVRPLVRRAGLLGPDAEQAEATGWATAWEVLRRPSARTADNPAGMVWVAVRRAVLGEAGALTDAGSGQLGARAWGRCPESDLPDLADLARSSGELSAPTDFHTSTDIPMGEHLSAVIVRLVAAGWERSVISEVVADLAEGAAASGGSGISGTGWRRVARWHGVEPWRVRRLATLLLGGPEAPGLLTVMLEQGKGVLDDPAAVEAIAATTRRWAAGPECHLGAWSSPRGLTPVPEPAPEPSAEPRIWHQIGWKRTVLPDRSPVGAPAARAAGPTSALHGGSDGRRSAYPGSPPPDSPEFP